jgi:hypothetical protein
LGSHHHHTQVCIPVEVNDDQLKRYTVKNEVQRMLAIFRHMPAITVSINGITVSINGTTVLIKLSGPCAT